MSGDSDPRERQMAALRIGLYSGTGFGALIIFLGLTFSHHVTLAVVVTAVFLVLDLMLSNFILKTARKNRAKGPSDSSFKPLN